MFKNLLAARTIGMALKNLSSTETDRGIAYSATIYHDGKRSACSVTVVMAAAPSSSCRASLHLT